MTQAPFMQFYLSIFEKMSTCTRTPNLKSVALRVLEICLRDSDVSPWPWPWSLRPKSRFLALALGSKALKVVLGLGLGLDSVGRGLDAIMLYTYTSWSLWYGICAPWILV